MFYFHQIKRIGTSADKGIAVKETLDAAKQSYHAYLGAYAFDPSKDVDMVSCMITDELGTILIGETWNKSETVTTGKFYLHQIKRSGETVDKGIVVKDSLDAAKQGYHAYLGAYGYGNVESVEFVHCTISNEDEDRFLMNEQWKKVVEPEPEPEPEPAFAE